MEWVAVGHREVEREFWVEKTANEERWEKPGARQSRKGSVRWKRM